jgi:RNA polymerase sigma factor (sigma-70 family)
LAVPAANTLRWIGEGRVTTEPRKAGDDANDPGMAAVTPVLSMQEVSDAEIIRQSCGEPERFAAIFDRYYAQIHGYAARRLGQGLADDVAAETFLVAFARRERYEVTRPDARPWLYGIVSNLISRHHRAEHRRYRALARSGAHQVSEGHEEEVAIRLDAQAYRGPLAAALAGISSADRDVLLLVAWAQLTSDEAGEALGIPAGTARSRLHRARKRIRAALAQPAAQPLAQPSAHHPAQPAAGSTGRARPEKDR